MDAGRTRIAILTMSAISILLFVLLFPGGQRKATANEITVAPVTDSFVQGGPYADRNFGTIAFCGSA